MATKQVNFRVPEELIAAAERRAESLKITLADYYRGLLEKDLRVKADPVTPGRPRKEA